jgi:hypothetical protein
LYVDVPPEEFITAILSKAAPTEKEPTSESEPFGQMVVAAIPLLIVRF